MSRRIAIAFVHGVEISDPHFADTAIALLKRSFARQCAPAEVDPDAALAIRTVFWAPALDPLEDRLLARTFHPKATSFFDRLTRLVTRINAGSQAAMVPFGFSGLLRWVPGMTGFHYPTLRWLITNFLGDAVAYQITPSDRRVYDCIHGVFAETLRDLAAETGGDAPLCVIAHSLGTIFASNYFYDLEATTARGRALIPASVQEASGDTPLERGETLLHFNTLGSPIALWTLRYPDFGVPIQVPSPRMIACEPRLAALGGWVNFFDRDDVIAYPIRGLSPLYEKAVVEDCEVSVGPFWVSWNPLAHPWYWNDRSVIDPIAARLVRTYRAMSITND